MKLDSEEFSDHITFLQNLKQTGPAAQTKVRMDCWMIINMDEKEHQNQLCTSTFSVMTQATKAQFEAFCKLRNRMRDKNTVQLLWMSQKFEDSQFTQLTMKVFQDMPVQTWSSRKRLKELASSSSEHTPVDA